MKFHTLFFLILFPLSMSANLEKSWLRTVKSRGSLRPYPSLIRKLINQGFYYASIPYIKEYLIVGRGVRAKVLDGLIDKVVAKVGIKQFEVLPARFLEHSHAPMLRYILAKKYFRQRKYNRALKVLNRGMGYNHSIRPFALHLEGAILSIKKKYLLANEKFKHCVFSSKKDLNKSQDFKRRRQLRINKDSCLAGIARNYFSAKKFDRANSAYLDIEKSSPIWPEILFEEAWNSFYKGNYNRTLGKLVTYKAPVLNYIYNPEIDVLRALAYMELCLWEDTKSVVDSFYKNYEQDVNYVTRVLKNNRRNLKEFYLIAKENRVGRTENKLLNSILTSLNKDAAYQELYQSFVEGKAEIDKVSRIRSGRLRRALISNIKDSMILQRNIMGAYVKKGLTKGVASVEKMFEGMSYIKLEVLSKRKKTLYNESTEAIRSRGSFRYLKRNDKQYFWTFNGEFWADELGDYVFALKSEC